MQASKSTIHFTGTLLHPDAIHLPKTASANLPSPLAIVEGTLNGFPFRALLKATANKTYTLKLTEPLLTAASIAPGDTVTIELTRIGDEPETRPPVELLQCLAAAPKAQAQWTAITSNARRDWILWITSAKLPATRLIRVQKACSMLASGKKRVCCFGGLNWLTKDHPQAETWLPLPKPK
jgi:hypothetical protein